MSILKKKQPEPAPLIVINLDRLKKTGTSGKKVGKKNTVKKTASNKSAKKKKSGKMKQAMQEVSIAVKVIKKLLWCVKLIFKAIVKVIQTLLGRRK